MTDGPREPRSGAAGVYTEGADAAVPLPPELAGRVLDAIGYAVVVLDRQGEITYWNGAAERLYGWSAEEAAGQRAAMMLAAPGEEAQLHPFLRAVLHGRSHRGRQRVRRKDGGTFTAMVSGSPVRDATHDLVGAVLVCSDLTAQEAATAAVEQAAERARDERNELLAVMSHELRTPLTAILGYQELLDAEIAGPLTPQQRLHLSRIRTSSWHLLDLTEQMLSMSRLDSGKETVRLESFSGVHAAQEVAALVEAQATARGLRLRVESPEEDVVLRSDSGKLRQVLLNLAINAVKFTPAGEITIAVTPRDGGRSVEFRVRDTGIGFSPEDGERIFEPFTQLDRTRGRAAGGVGLGLAVVRRLVELLGGTITVASAPGVGSEFCVRLSTLPQS